MTFHQDLTTSTLDDRDYLLSASVIGEALRGRITLEIYLGFLTQAYHHVRHTVPLMMTVGARLPDRLAWLRQDLMHYLEEETGHDDWILNDIAAAGGDRVAAAGSKPHVTTDAMVAYAYDVAFRRNPVGFFGMVHVLEGTSAAIALQAADAIAACLDLPARAFTYLRSHGQLDREHTKHLASILDRLECSEDRAAVLQCARAMYWLYGNMFRALVPRGASTCNEIARRSA